MRHSRRRHTSGAAVRDTACRAAVPAIMKEKKEVNPTLLFFSFYKTLSFFFCELLTAVASACAFAPSASRAQTPRNPRPPPRRQSPTSRTFPNFQIKRLASGMLKVAGYLRSPTLARPKPGTSARIFTSQPMRVGPHRSGAHVFAGGLKFRQFQAKSGGQVEIALKQKVVSFIRSLLDGQYLLIELTADNNTSSPADKHNVIVVAPISVPK